MSQEKQNPEQVDALKNDVELLCHACHQPLGTSWTESQERLLHDDCLEAA